MLDRTPVIIGAAQVIRRPGESDPAGGAIELMVAAARAAAVDAGAGEVLRAVGWVGVAGGWFAFGDPGRLVASAIGAADARTALTGISGSAPQELVGLAAQRVVDGTCDIALVVGGEARYSEQQHERAGTEVPWPTGDDGAVADERIGDIPRELMTEARQLGTAAHVYPILDVAARGARHETVDEHRDRIAALWAGYNSVAVGHPFAWDRTPRTVAEIRDPGPGNRMISWPYPKLMCANNTVDMASALVVCTAEKARALGVASDRWVFPHAVTKASDTVLLAQRRDLHRSPAIRESGTRALDGAGISIDDVGHLDLYACFPAIVAMTCDELAIAPDRTLTVTGGLCFAGAPVGNAAGQSVAAMVHAVRQDPGSWGLVHGNGGYATKHSFGVYSTCAPTSPWTFVDCQDEVDHQARPTTEDHVGPLVIEGYTVVHDRQGPTEVRLAGITSAQCRVFARNANPDVVAEFLTGNHLGVTAHRQADGMFAM